MKIFGRRTGISFTGICLTIAAMYGGYKAWQEFTSPYKLQQESGIYYLLEKDTEKKEIITEDFQLGSLDYRIKGLLKESKVRFRESLDRLANDYEPDQRQTP